MATSRSDTAIHVRGLTKAYGGHRVLDGIDIDVDYGEVVALLGPNGAGKTTTIEILEGSRTRDSGEVAVLGVDPQRPTEAWRAQVGMVMQSWRDHARWSPLDLLTQMRALYEPFARDDERPLRPAMELVELVGLRDEARQRIRTLSGGQRRRLDVAIGIVGRPRLLFLDEPTAGLDPEGRREFHDLVHALVDQDETTVLLTTHDLGEAAKLSDRILILAGGRVVANGSDEELARSIASQAEVRWRVGESCHVHATADATAFVRSLLAGPDGDSVTDLVVAQPTLEDTYVSLVRRHEDRDPMQPTVTEEANL